ncbi:MAG: PhzF family phenazine biosynthesis protein [Anaerolineaceae bacterium]|nr:PhzF family phenazine biosynthesis protein [Anaerolineaceae bacterium]
MNIPIYQVDAFTIKPFTGNPAAVCLLEHDKNAAWMQAVATEMNLSETAFLVPQKDGYHLRWFTPTTEIDLCGHATLASAHILYEFGFYEEDEQIEFYTLSGTLTASYREGFIELDMPHRDAVEMSPLTELDQALGQTPVKTLYYENDLIMAELVSESAVKSFAPNFELLNKVPYKEIIITAKTDEGKYDFVSRFFAPRMGINEDPVTGSAHCILGPYWAKNLNKSEFLAFQASFRTGEVRVRLGDNRVHVGGKAITVLRGDLLHQ